MAKTILFFVFFLVLKPLMAQDVKNTSYVTKSGEKVLRLEVIVPCDKKTAWEYFSRDEKLILWIAPVAHVELKTCGSIRTNYDKNKSLADSSSIDLPIINYIENELLTLKVILNNNFTELVRKEGGNLQEIIQFVDVGKGKTKIVSSMVGWGTGADWDKTYAFFLKGNEWTYRELLKAVK